MKPQGPRRRFGTAARLSGALAILLGIVLAVSAWATWISFSRRTTAQATNQIAAELRDFCRALGARGGQPLNDWAVSYLSLTALPSGEHVLIALRKQARFGSQGSSPLLKDLNLKRLLENPPSKTTTQTLETPMGTTLVVTSPIMDIDKRIGTVVVTYDLSSLESDQHRVLVLVLIEAAIALLVAVLGTYLLLRRLLGNIGRITTTARTIEEGDLDLRLGDQGSDDEVGELAATFDSMLDRIDQIMGIQRQLLSDVSHQLKTPLTVMRGHLEVLARTGVDDPEEVRRTIATVLAEVEHLRSMTEELLLLGRSLEPGFLDASPNDLRALIGDVGRSAEVLGDRNIAVGAVPDLVVQIDGHKMRGALLNLVDNAVKATSPGDRIELSASLRHPGGEVVLTVADSGPGVPVADRDRVLERFGRPRMETRAGSGLGLAIVGTVAEAHGGHIELGDASLGGLAASIVLPSTVVLHIESEEEL